MNATDQNPDPGGANARRIFASAALAAPGLFIRRLAQAALLAALFGAAVDAHARLDAPTNVRMVTHSLVGSDNKVTANFSWTPPPVPAGAAGIGGYILHLCKDNICGQAWPTETYNVLNDGRIEGAAVFNRGGAPGQPVIDPAATSMRIVGLTLGSNFQVRFGSFDTAGVTGRWGGG
ncbi:MAG: hypothetical protein OD817_01425 [Gammaproteobacteria bacterium]